MEPIVGTIVHDVATRLTAPASGRPLGAMLELTVAAGEHGVPRTDVPAMAKVAQDYLFTPLASDGVIELQLPSHQTAVVRALGELGDKLTYDVDGDLLHVHAPAGTGRLHLDTAMQSGGDSPIRLQPDRLEIDEPTARVIGGAEVHGRPANHLTGIVPPDERTMLVKFHERGWELPTSSLGRQYPDQVDPYHETLTASLSGSRDTSFHATAQYTGRADGHATEGRLAEARRGFRSATTGILGTIYHVFEH